MTQRSALTRFSYVAAPALLVAYGSIRLLVDTSKEPGAGWTSGHLAFLGSMLLFGVVFVGLYQQVRAARPRTAAVGLGAAMVGLAASVTQAVIDLVVGFQVSNVAEMSETFGRIQGYPGVMPAIYDVGPQFLFIGLITLVAAAAAGGAASAGRGSRAVGWWALALVVVGTAAVASNLDLMPVGGACYVLALGALARSAVPAGGVGRATAIGRG